MPEPTDVRVEAAITAMLDTRMADGDLWATALYAMLPVCRHWHKGGEQDVRDFLREPVRAALSASPAPGGWRDIASAPRDSSMVIVPGGIAHWHKGRWWTLTGEQSPGRPIEWEVLHWMPFPPAPGADPTSLSHDPGAAEAEPDEALVDAVAGAIHTEDDGEETAWPDGPDDDGHRGDGAYLRLADGRARDNRISQACAVFRAIRDAGYKVTRQVRP